MNARPARANKYDMGLYADDFDNYVNRVYGCFRINKYTYKASDILAINPDQYYEMLVEYMHKVDEKWVCSKCGAVYGRFESAEECCCED